uniref:Single domain-containing protein n=1 Tax=Amblyomma maculatum TaxID=34609 RepID=G3MRJ5_AMBMU
MTRRMRLAMACLLFVEHISVLGQKVTVFSISHSPGECHLNGETYHDGIHTERKPCQMVECNASAHEMIVVECGDEGKNEGCLLQPGENKPYPDCCPEYSC